MNWNYNYSKNIFSVHIRIEYKIKLFSNIFWKTDRYLDFLIDFLCDVHFDAEKTALKSFSECITAYTQD